MDNKKSRALNIAGIFNGGGEASKGSNKIRHQN